MMPIMLGYNLVEKASMTVQEEWNMPLRNKTNRGIVRHKKVMTSAPSQDFIIDERTKTIYAHPFMIGILKSKIGLGDKL